MRNTSAADPSFLVLASLAGGNKHGYAIMDDVEQFAGTRLGPGTLYGAITRLEDRGWIRGVSSDDDRRRPYTLTAAGRRHLQEHAAHLDAVAKTALGRLNA